LTGPRRLLLLEFVGSSPLRNERADFFPFYQGFAESAGIPARWLCAGARFEELKKSPTEVRSVPVLERGDRDALARRLAEWNPTHVLVNEELSPELRRLVKAAAPRGELILATEENLRRRTEPGEDPAARHDLLLTRFFQTGWLSRWLGRPRNEDRYFVGAVEPRYDAVMMNPQAREFMPFLSILGGVSCDYRADVSRNPLYRGVDLSGCARRGGCTFCSPAHPPASAPSDDALELARTQFAAIARDAAASGRSCGRFNVRDIRLFRRLDEFFDMILALDLPPSDFFFAPRIDDLLRAGAVIEKLLPKLAERGHRLNLFRMGVEQFSPRENARFNKGVSPRRIDEGLALADRLKAAHPGRFDYARPLGYIAFTPWTTLKDLELSVGEGIKRGFDPQAPWLYAALELSRGSPITALARHEGGIVRERYDDVALTYGLMADERSRPGLLPWRMKDRRAAVACGLIVRFCAVSLRGIMPDAVFAKDALYAWLKKLVDARGPGATRPDLFAAEIVGLMKTARPPWNKRKLIRAALERLERRGVKEEKPPTPPEPSKPEAAAAWRPFLAGLDAQFRLGGNGPCRSRYDGEILSVAFGRKRLPLVPVPKASHRGAYYAQTPSCCICIRGRVRMTEPEQRRLRIYLELLARRDETLKTLLRP